MAAFGSQSVTNFNSQQGLSDCIWGTYIALLSDKLNFILKDSNDKELIPYQFSSKSCLAVKQNKRKKQRGLCLVVYLYASGARFWNNSKGPIHFMPPAAK